MECGRLETIRDDHIGDKDLPTCVVEVKYIDLRDVIYRGELLLYRRPPAQSSGCEGIAQRRHGMRSTSSVMNPFPLAKLNWSKSCLEAANRECPERLGYEKDCGNVSKM